MTRSYRILLLAVIGLALALAVWGRRPSTPAAPPDSAAAEIAVAIDVRYAAGRVSDATAPAGARVRLTLHNDDTASVTVRLAGYDDRWTPPALAPGATWTTTFLADRPGDDFAWMVGDVPVGRFRVSGSHLVEGHR